MIPRRFRNKYNSTPAKQGVYMAKKSRGGRMTAAKRRAAKAAGGRGRIKNRKAGRRIMKS